MKVKLNLVSLFCFLGVSVLMKKRNKKASEFGFMWEVTRIDGRWPLLVLLRA